MYPLLTRWRRTVVLVASAAATVAALVAVPAGPAQAQPPTCVSVAFSASTWSTGPDTGGFAASIILTNTCPATINGWTLELTFAPDHRLSHGWSANWTASGSQISATGLPWNSVLHPGQSTTVGFVGSFSGTYQDPIGCTINGLACDDGGPGENQPPEVTLTSPADGSGFAGPCAVTLAAEASDPDGPIDRVEFYINDVLVGTVDDAPYQIEVLASHPAMSRVDGNVVLARAFDTGSPAASTDSQPVTFYYLIPPPTLMMIACPPQLELPEGGSRDVTLHNFCASTPEVQMTVTGDAGVSVSPTSFTLPATGGAVVTISAAVGSAGAEAQVRAHATDDCAGATIWVTVVDGDGPGENEPPEVTLTRPADGDQFVTSCPVTLSATATDPDGAIDRVEFYLNDVLVGTVDTAPYRIVVPANHPAMSLATPKVAMARAVDNGSPARSADSAPASFGYLPPPPALWLITCTTRLELAEGDAEVVQFLNICGSAQQVELVITGDAGISASPSSFALPHNGRQDVTISAAPGTAGAEAVVQPQGACSSAPVRVTVVEAG